MVNLDLGKYRQAAANNTTPFSPPVNLIVALQTTLQMLQKEGLESIFTRHERLKNATRAAMKVMNLPLLAADNYASSALTSVAPQGIEPDKIRYAMKQRFNLELAGGQDYLKNKIFRIGHLGFVSDRDILSCIASLEAVLPELGYENFTLGSGVAAVARIFTSR